MNVDAAAPAGDVEMGDSAQEAGGVPAEVLAAIDETHQALSATRKKRKAPEGYATAAEVKGYTSKHVIPSRTIQPPIMESILDLDLAQFSISQFQKWENVLG